MAPPALLYHVRLAEDVAVEALVDVRARAGQLLAHLASEYGFAPPGPGAALWFKGRVLRDETVLSSIPEKSTLLYSISGDTSSQEQTGVPEQVYQDLIEINKYYPGLLVNAVPSLYIRVSINGTPVVCVIDTGAEFNSMGRKTARACGLEGHIDTRYAGRAIGVGSTRMLGRIHICLMQCGDIFLPMNFAVLDSVCDTLIGMSALSMYRAMIDLSSFSMTLGGASIPLLTNQEIEEYHQEHGT
ncbi:DDI1-like DNA-damage inducible protein [Giardia duodenalis]|uniref:DDI1-like DNA-damage inducible protein n=1 Tax=Giardia intestinalis (strain ATCC 50803 / WB clone C6) TaxID=184922 RepID=A8B333_GIAIC|nr:DDI1-like DNA-damage inducible protein [Giardia intestinalis]KAE8303093.1 DDI1-like DNA-damage inducible protein [Giardia intestinalis]|eukprot:XP_001710113.1 DNA-damage inducible protein DDI1-like [Giardia lamblia ATCC 50803]